MTRREWWHVGTMVVSAGGGVFLVARVFGGVLGQALTNGAALCAIAGVVCLALGAVWRR